MSHRLNMPCLFAVILRPRAVRMFRNEVPALFVLLGWGGGGWLLEFGVGV